MEPDIIQVIGNYGILGLLGYVFVKDFFIYIGNKKNGNGYSYDKKLYNKDTTQDVIIAVLKEQMNAVLTNHIPHIENSLKEMKQEFELARAERKSNREMLIKIMAKLNIEN